MEEKYCYFDDGNGVCHASESDECPYDYDMICKARVDVHGNDLGLPDGFIDEKSKSIIYGDNYLNSK